MKYMKNIQHKNQRNAAASLSHFYMAIMETILNTVSWQI